MFSPTHKSSSNSHSQGLSILTLLIFQLVILPATTVRSQSVQSNRQLKQDSPQKQTRDHRIALVIGNSAYQNAHRLANPENDAEDMATILRDLGFELVGGQAQVNQTADQMRRLIVAFGERLSRGGIGLFYYAGHGVQSQGHNYLIPIEANILREKTLEFEAVDTNRVLDEMDAAGNGFNVVILDACRNNPFARSWRDTSQGLAQLNAPEGTLIAYSTSPGRVASDGSGRNGTYTAELLRQMRVPSLTIEEMFKAVRAGVKAATSNQQTPWESSSLVGEFCFTGSCGDHRPRNTATEGDGPKIDAMTIELSFWDSIKNSNDPEDFKAYLARYPNGQFADLARRRSQGRQDKISDPTNAGNGSTFFTIRADARADNLTNGWTNSGLRVRIGQRVRISAAGRVSLGKLVYSGPEGVTINDPNKLLRNAPTGALIAVIGDDNDDFIFIGSRREFVAQRNGVLFLGVNEGNLSDNTGTYEVVIEAEVSSNSETSQDKISDQGSTGNGSTFFSIRANVRADNVDNGWTNTGLVVRIGQRVRISAAGRVSLGKLGYSGPEGMTINDPDRLMRTQPTGALIAVVGNDNDDFIFIGNRREFVANRTGVLFLGVNEGDLSDNSGSYQVVIEAEAGSSTPR
jgi:Caspase domain